MLSGGLIFDSQSIAGFSKKGSPQDMGYRPNGFGSRYYQFPDKV
jgi:hypothetical protein